MKKIYDCGAKHMANFGVILFLLVALSALKTTAQSTLIDFNFTSATLPAGLSADAGSSISTSGAIGSCNDCSLGRLNVVLSGYLQIDAASTSVVRATMKSSASGVRTVIIKYKLADQSEYTTAGTVAVPGTGGLYDLHTLFPAVVSVEPISIRIENSPTGGQFHIHDIFVQSSANAGTAAEIQVFKLPGQLSAESINSALATVEVKVPAGTDLTAVVPSQVVLSTGASINPTATTARNFSGGALVPYTVTATDGTTTKAWTVKAIEVQSAEKEITSFKLSNEQLGNAVINSAAGTITVIMPESATLTGLVPVIFTLSPFATVSPLVSEARDFTAPVAYWVTAQNGSTKPWTITASTPSESFSDYEAEQAVFTGTVDNNHTGFTGTGFVNFLSSGENEIVFSVCQILAGTHAAKFRYALGAEEARPGKLFVNDVFVQDINFAPTGAWTNWADETIPVPLLAGMNNIKIAWDTADGPNLDKLMLSGAACSKYTVTVNATNGGSVSLSPERFGNQYFDVETVTLLAAQSPGTMFENWSGDLSGTTNPVQVLVDGNKNITANFITIPTYTLQVNTSGVGEVTLNPEGSEYAAGTEVTLTAKTVLGSSFVGWGGDATGNAITTTVLMNANKTVSATFTNSPSINFEVPVGFASVNTGSTYPDFNGPVTGGQGAVDTFWVNGPADFDALAWRLYYRNRAYRLGTPQNGVPKAPLVIAFKKGVYPEGTSTSSAWGNSMMTIQEQGDLTIIGEKNVVLKFGFNVKRSWNILIRNIHFQDYYDDGINIGEPETHHIWIDHCTLGHPTTRPVNIEHPDGGVDSKNGASYITISWSLIRNSWKTSLVGHSDNNGSEDNGKLKVTYYANHFLNTNSRNPRVRFGEVHVLNNLNENVNLYGIAAAIDARVVAEGNFYLNTRWAMYADRTVTDFRAVYGNNTDNVFTSKTGNIPAQYLKQFNNDYDDSGLPVITAQINPAMLNPGGRSIKFDELNPHLAFDPKSYYNYTAFSPSVVRTIVPLFAGADKVDFFNPPPPKPYMNIEGSLTSFNQYLGIPSSSQSYSVSGNQLSANITITPPVNYEVSADSGTTWHSNAAPLVLAQSGGAVPVKNISVRLNAPGLGAYTGSILHTTNGMDGIDIDLSGNTVPSIYPPGVAVVVAWDGTGNYTTVQAAINAAPTGRTTPYIIFIKNGKYFEKVTVPSNKPFIHLVGESVANVIIYHNTGASDPLPGGGTVGTQNSASFTVNATDFAAFNITFANTYGDGTQGVAILVNNDRAVFKNCRFMGNQDTLYVKGSGTPRQYFKDCYIDGNVDFIFGSAVAVFDAPVIYPKSRTNAGSSFITAANTPAGQTYGYVFRNSTIPNNTGATNYYLGRPWQNSSGASPLANNKVVFLNTTMGTSIRGEGWTTWDAGTNTSLIYFGEYASRQFNGSPVDISQRVPWSYQLTEAEANTYTNANLFGAWDPCAVAAGICTNEARDIAISNFRGKKQPANSLFEWNISWAKDQINYELFRSATRNGSYIKIGEVLSTNNTDVNFSLTDELPASGSSYFYYLVGSKANFASHITDTIEISSRPAITVAGVLQPFVQTIGTPSASQNLTVSGVNLLGNITITPPAHFEVSIDNGVTWIENPATTTLSPTNNVLAPTTLMVRLNANTVASYSDSLLFETTGGFPVKRALTGVTVNLPAGYTVTLQHWPFISNANDLEADRAIGVVPSTPTMENLFVSNGLQVPAIQAYSEQFGQAFGASANGDGSWGTGVGGPGGTLRRTHYEQFTITSAQGFEVRVDSLYVTAAFYNTSSNTRLAVVYSKSGFQNNDSTDVFTIPGGFANPILLANQTTGPTNRYALSFAGPDGIKLQPGETLTFRFYLSCGSTSAGRYAMLKNVRVTGESKPDGALPLQLRSFTGLQQAGQIKLNWTTAQEVSTSHFEVEKGVDGREFATIGSVKAASSTGVQSYNFTDHQILPANYYRLKMVDIDGRFTYSNVLLFKSSANSNLSLYPNPASSFVTIVHGSLPPSASVRVTIFDGRHVLVHKASQGALQTRLDVSKIPVGIYLLIIEGENGRQSLKFIRE